MMSLPKQQTLIIIIVLAGMICSIILSDILLFRYFIYSAPAFAFIGWISSHHSSSTPSDFFPLFIFGVYSLISLPIAENISEYYLRDSLIIALTLFIMPLTYHVSASQIKIAFFGFIAVVLLLVLIDQGNISSFNILHSTVTFETVYSLTVGMFLVYFLGERKYFISIVCFCALLLIGKRIVFASTVITIMFHLSMLTFNRNNQRWKNFLALSLVVLLGFIVSFHFNTIFALTISYLKLDVSVGYLTMGRSYFTETIRSFFTSSDFAEQFFGHGAGTAHSLIASIYGVQLAHNDFLKLIVDYGYLGTAIFFAFIIWATSKSRLATTLAVYNIVIMLTDNPLVYFWHLIFAVFVIRSSLEHLDTDHRLTSPIEMK